MVNRISVPVDLAEEEFRILAKMAHEQDITFNQLCVNILREQVEKEEGDLLRFKVDLADEFDRSPEAL